MNRFDIAGIDTPWFDQLVRLEKMPADNESMKISEVSCQGGGKVATALVAASRLGISTGIIAVMGNNSRGRFLLEDFKRHDVNTDNVEILDGYTDGYSIVLSDKESGGRRILWDYDFDSPKVTEEQLEKAKPQIANAKYLHLCRTDKADILAAKYAKEKGVKVCFDGDFYSDEVIDNLGFIDYFIGSEDFYGQCFQGKGDIKENMAKLTLRGVNTVIFTFGKKGCAGLYDGHKYFEQPAFTNINVKDTVGAGDVFHGAFIAGLCRDMTVPEAARFASAVSAVKCTKIGGRAGIPDFDTVTDFINKGIINDKELVERENYYKSLRI